MDRRSFFARHEATRALAHHDFRLLLLGTGIVGFVQPVQYLTQVFWVQERYPGRAVLYVGLIAASRGAAMRVGGNPAAHLVAPLPEQRQRQPCARNPG